MLVVQIMNLQKFHLNILIKKHCVSVTTPASYCSGNMFVSGVGGLKFKSWASQIGHSAANGLPPLQHFFDRSCVARAQRRGDGPHQLVYTLWRNTASIMKNLMECLFTSVHQTSVIFFKLNQVYASAQTIFPGIPKQIFRIL